LIVARGSKVSSAQTRGIPADLFAGLEVEVKREVALEKYTSLRIGGPAEILALPRTVEALRELLALFFSWGRGATCLHPTRGSGAL